MSEMHLSDEDLVLVYYGEQEPTGHLLDCAGCERRLADLARDLPLLTGEMPVPERDADYGRWVWFRLRPQLTPPRRNWQSALAAGVMLLLLGGFAAGRYSASRPAPLAAQRVDSPRAMHVALGEHLERSQLVLLEIDNAPPEAETDFSGEQARAESLLTPNRLYRQAAVSAGDGQAVRVLEDLERILLEVAHSPAKVSAEELGEIRNRIRQQGIMFRVKVEEVRQEILEQ